MITQAARAGCGVAIAVLIASCSANLPKSVEIHEHGAPPASSSVVSFDSNLPAGFDPVRLLAGDTAQPGVWFWSASRTESRMFFQPDHGALQSWRLGIDDASRLPQGPGGLAIDPGGDAWFAINSRLFHVTRSSGLVGIIDLPAPAAADVIAVPGPPELQNIHPASALAVNATTVAVGVVGASILDVVTRSSGTVRTVRLPTGTDVVALGYFRDGTLAVGLTDETSHDAKEVMLLHTDGSLQGPVAVEESSVISSSPSAASGEPVLIGGVAPEYLYSNGMTASDTGISDAAPTEPGGGGPERAPDGRIVYPSSDGVGVHSPGASNTSDIQFPQLYCGPLGQPGEPVCPSRPNAFAVDKFGDIWFSTNGQSGKIGVIQAGSY